LVGLCLYLLWVYVFGFTCCGFMNVSGFNYVDFICGFDVQLCVLDECYVRLYVLTGERGCERGGYFLTHIHT
jgi:hypothetical protein